MYVTYLAIFLFNFSLYLFLPHQIQSSFIFFREFISGLVSLIKVYRSDIVRILYFTFYYIHFLFTKLQSSFIFFFVLLFYIYIFVYTHLNHQTTVFILFFSPFFYFIFIFPYIHVLINKIRISSFLSSFIHSLIHFFFISSFLFLFIFFISLVFRVNTQLRCTIVVVCFSLFFHHQDYSRFLSYPLIHLFIHL